MIRFYNGKLLSLRDGSMAVTNDEVWTKDDRIEYVGPARADAPVFEREVDLHGDLLMPGFKNAHAHGAMTFLRSYADDLPLHEWLFDRVFPLEARLNADRVYAFTRLAILEYLTSGITAAFDMYMYPDSVAQAGIDCGFRTVLCGSLTANNDWEELASEHARFNGVNPLLSHMLGFHAEYTASVPMLEYVAALAQKEKAPVWSHHSETRSEVDECIARHGKTPTALFDDLGLFQYGGGGYHCVYLTKEDREIFLKRGLWAVTCPASNAKLASGIAEITTMRGEGVHMAIGTDGPASNNALDMFREMYLTCVLQKLRENNAAACDADDVLRMAARDGALAMGLNDCDCIAPGKQADMIVLDMSRPNMRPPHCLTKNIVYSGSKENVRLTMIAGRILYENGEFFVGEDPERIYAEAEREVAAML
ncbi:MAG: amidohydrolase [Eubacteriales bacterium]|nr:amidohydrolase [Eubacteriales bacterium]